MGVKAPLSSIVELKINGGVQMKSFMFSFEKLSYERDIDKGVHSIDCQRDTWVLLMVSAKGSGRVRDRECRRHENYSWSTRIWCSRIWRAGYYIYYQRHFVVDRAEIMVFYIIDL